MGYYFQGSGPRGKGQELIAKGAREITRQEASQLIESSAAEAVFCVLDNGPFEAAGLVYSPREFAACTMPKDTRPKRWYAMEKATAHALVGYTETPV